MPVNDEIRDKLIRHQIGLFRHGSGVTKEILRIMAKTEKDLLEQIWAYTGEDKRLKALLQTVYDIQDAAINPTKTLMKKRLQDLSEYEVEYNKTLIEGAIPVKLNMVMPTSPMILAIATDQPFAGKLLDEWVEDLTDSAKRNIRDVLRVGMVEGQSVDQMARRIRGTRAMQYRDGLMEISRRHAQAMVRTAVIGTADAARTMLYKENAELIAKVQWCATLDTRTCPVCGARDSQTFPIDSGPRPPAHIGCRCCTVPVTKSWRELGFDMDETPPSTRASMDGQISETTTYNEWLKNSDAATQDYVLGKGKGRMFREGGLQVKDFVDQNTDRVYTLKDLKAMEKQ